MYRGPADPRVQSRFKTLVFWGQDANVTMRVYWFSFKAEWSLLKLQGKHSNLQKGISWKRNRLEIFNKIEAKRASNATRERNTLVGVGLRWCDDGDEVIPSLTVSAFSRELKTCVVHATSLDRIMLDVLGKAEKYRLGVMSSGTQFLQFLRRRHVWLTYASGKL